MTDDAHQHARDLLADIRAVAASLTDRDNGFAENAVLGSAAWNRGPAHAVMMTAWIAARRLAQVSAACGQREASFPREQLHEAMRVPSPGVVAAVDLVGEVMSSPVPDPEPVDRFVSQHGLVGFMSLVQVANKTGEMLVDADPEFDDLAHLVAREAAADEREWGQDRPTS